MTEQNLFKEKRNDLELFLNEQIIGPGAFNKKFFLLKDWQTTEFNGKSLVDCKALENVSEIISELPAYQYSSAILFPISITAEEASFQAQEMIEDEADQPDFDEPILTKADDEDLQDDQVESTSSKNQNYPNTCGLSFAVRNDISFEHDLAVMISFRQYHKVNQKECQERSLGLWLDQYPEEIKEVITKYFAGIFKIVERDDNKFICLADGVNVNEYLYSLDYVNLEQLVQDRLLPLIKSIFPDKQFFKPVIKVYDNVSYNFTTIYEDALTDELQNRIQNDSDNFGPYKELIFNLEVYNKVKSFSNELKSIFRKSTSKNFPTPIWKSVSYKMLIKLTPFLSEKNVLRGEMPVDGFNKLSLSYQYLRDKSSIFIKLILVNRACIKLKVDEPPQLNKKDLANELAFFGVKIMVNERSKNCLVPYNAPNLSVIDEEDNFNKLLYRNFKNYAEGYNTSVNWGGKANSAGLKYIHTEFIPVQDTPNVDFKPSKIAGDQVVSLIEDNVLSIRGLSTLSGRTDTEVLQSLVNMVDAYGLWILEKRLILTVDDTIHKGKFLLEKQLNACDNDLKRLHRNITLLRDNPLGLAAFRIMNTAMFMQLHHSITIKGLKKVQKGPFIPENTASFYKNVQLENEYMWRSFQLAFVLLNIDAFIRPAKDDKTVHDVFGMGWPERNELADLVWFPTGGGKTEAYLGIIAFTIAYRRFTNGDERGKGTTVLMRYTLRLLTLQQFQRATLLICAMEVIRKDSFVLPGGITLGKERITIGLFVGKGSLPNTWDQMREELDKIIEQLNDNRKIKTNLPHTECPWCGGTLFSNAALLNVEPKKKDSYRLETKLTIMCNTNGCSFYGRIPNENKGLPLRLFDEDIYKFPPTLLFGTVDKFASLANKVSTKAKEMNQDSRRLLGNGNGYSCLPPELIIQDELHLLLGPLGSAVGLLEKGIDELCSYMDGDNKIRPKIITSTATTRNTDKQIFALFDRRCEIFPKQGITCDDSFFSFYKRDAEDVKLFSSNRRYLGLLPVGKTQVWMQLRVASICLVHRVKFLKERFNNEQIIGRADNFRSYEQVLDYYHTVLSYFNSLKEVGKTQSQLNHYLPGDLNLVLKNTVSWTFLSKIIKRSTEIVSSELTGRLSGEEVKTNLASIELTWRILKSAIPPEFVIATNMISVGIDVSRFNTMVINSMPRNTAEYIQASSRVARDKEGLVLTVHHPFRSRDISHYQRFKEFHSKFYSYVEPISITPFANKALDRYFAMYLAVIIRHSTSLGLANNMAAATINQHRIDLIKTEIVGYIDAIRRHAVLLNSYLNDRHTGVRSNVEGIIGDEELEDIKIQLDDLLVNRWLERIGKQDPVIDLMFRTDLSETSLFKPRSKALVGNNWNVKESLREIAPSIVIKTVQQ